jgi:hypothetical protein
MGEEGQRRYLVLAMGTLAGPGPATELLRLSRARVQDPWRRCRTLKSCAWAS